MASGTFGQRAAAPLRSLPGPLHRPGRHPVHRAHRDGSALTFDTKQYADAWLSRVSGDILPPRWLLPRRAESTKPAAVTLRRLRPRRGWPAGTCRSPPGCSTRNTLAAHPPRARDARRHRRSPRSMVREWTREAPGETGPTQRAHAYSLLRTILNTAVADDLIPANPCRVRGAGSAKRARQIKRRVARRAGDDRRRRCRPGTG